MPKSDSNPAEWKEGQSKLFMEWLLSEVGKRKQGYKDFSQDETFNSAFPPKMVQSFTWIANQMEKLEEAAATQMDMSPEKLEEHVKAVDDWLKTEKFFAKEVSKIGRFMQVQLVLPWTVASVPSVASLGAAAQHVTE